ncbi:helix-turn-helix domain-containing protein [Mobiluncus curtisii]|uniref:helix-turn-helix domain-containing protein n=1 Tax=Mobiluncus curtisii TaxID=2051 RepID=UPI0014706B35|nr:helix-turn-helix transcriptional regulator [Mobiluncus curtisii]NMW88077.1 helix-turn-helix transcriptional regulator [Mobiluncus curtisii]
MSLAEDGETFTENLSKLIAEIAGRCGVSQNQLAKKSGISQSQVSRIFRQERAISMSQAYALACALEVDVVILFAVAYWTVTNERPEVLTDKVLRQLFAWKKGHRQKRMHDLEGTPWGSLSVFPTGSTGCLCRWGG